MARLRNPLRDWMDKATAAEQHQLAKSAGTTVGRLRQLAGGYRTRGKLQVRAESALKLERAAAMLQSKNPSLPSLLREQMSGACRSCEFAARCRA